ncbi:hypothetical protein D3C73_1132950 [compost metagenome]
MVYRQQLAAQRLRLGVQLQAYTRSQGLFGQLSRWRHQQHLALFPPAQPLAAQHQFQSLIPGNILQTQGNAALHRVAGDQIDAGIIGQYLQHKAYFHVLEVQRNRLTPIRRCRQQRHRQQGRHQPLHQPVHCPP